VRPIPQGYEGRVSVVVTEAMTVDFEELGRIHPLYATYWLCKHMEEAGRKIIIPFLEEGEEGIGSAVSARHLAPAVAGERVDVVAEHVLTERNRVKVRCRATNEAGRVIGEGETEQTILPRERIEGLIRAAAGATGCLESSEPASGGIGRDEFFAIMSGFATGVAVVTTLDLLGRPRGLTAQSVASVSAEPPLLLVCIDRTSRTLPALRARGQFVVNFLRADHDALCALFASKADDKFANVVWREAGNAMPVLHEGSLAYAECRTEREIEAGDHVVLIGLVVGGKPPSGGDVPLVTYRHVRGWPEP
jgi:flavin reductase (DIM6/NTAB) family NADH-FMN oxidoreductase RutF/predicted thioesterase